jgi:uncharacterized delta-60 repeat protein
MKNRFLGAVIATAILASHTCFAADGDPDPGFGDHGVAYLSIDGVEGHELRAGAVIALPDGKLLFGGSRNKLIDGNPDPHMRATLARMNADGSVDGSFGSDPANPGLVVLPDVQPGTGMQQIETMQRLDDGSLLVAGAAEAFGPTNGFVMKVDAQGAPVASYGNAGLVKLSGTHFLASAVDAQQRLLLAGYRNVAGSVQGVVVRLTTTGQFDPTFGSDANGIVRLIATGPDSNSYLSALTLTADGGVLVGGSVDQDDPILGNDFSLARLDASGNLDTTFAGNGWSRFRIPGDGSAFNGIEHLLVTPDGKIVMAGYHEDPKTGVNVVLGRFTADGRTDTTFGSKATPGFQPIDVVPDAWNRYPSGLVRLADGKLLVPVTYAIPGKQDFVAVRTSADGALDPTFGTGGMIDLDLAPDGIYSNLTAVTLQDGRPILAGSAKRDRVAKLVDLAAVRLGDTPPAGDDAIFADGFDRGPAASVTNYDDLAEGFKGPSFQHNGVTYRDVNDIGGVFPDGSTFTPADVGADFVIENATYLFNDFPSFGSAPNVLTFGTTYMPGPNLSLGALVRATMDLDTPASAASFEAIFYENGPWGGIQLHLDAYRNGMKVGEDVVTLSNLGGRDNLTTRTFSISGVTFDSLRLYATCNGQPSAPRVMIDNLSLTPAPVR